MKKVLCIVDSYRWALYNRAVALRDNFKEHYFDIIHFNEIDKIKFDSYDVVYSLNWPIHGYIHKKISPKKTRRYRLVVGISSHIGQPSDASFRNLLTNYDAVGLSNRFLYNSFRKKFKNINFIYTPFGVDCNVFKNVTIPADYSNVVGWVGNPDRSVKRFAEIKEAINMVSPKITLVTATNKTNYSRVEMADFYNRIGTLICFSESEGTPNPILEAAACGRNIISTKVGNVPELFSDANAGSIVCKKEDIAREIDKFVRFPDKINFHGQRFADAATRKWSWERQHKLFKPLLLL